MTYLIGIGGFAHVVAGASEVFYAAFRGEASWRAALLGYLARPSWATSSAASRW